MDEQTPEEELKRQKNREWYEANKAEQQEKARQRYAAKKTELRAKANARRQGKPREEYDPEARKRWYEKNKERLLAKKRQWEAEHPDKKREYNRKSYEQDRENRIQYERDKRAQGPGVAEYRTQKREWREWFAGRKWLQLCWLTWRGHLTWDRFKELTPQIENGPCEICGKTGERMQIDHCHKSDTFRGLLCRRCNMALGLFEDASTLLRKGADYLER